MNRLVTINRIQSQKEFDNPSFGYGKNFHSYRQAFRKIVQVCEQQLRLDRCHDKIAFCWHSWGAPALAPIHYFYPGDDVVDWVGVSIFQQVYPWANENNGDDGSDNAFAGGNLRMVKDVLEFAKLHDKPIMIAESAPFGGMYLEDAKGIELRYDHVGIWNLWFQPVLQLIQEYDIAMWSYINCDWNSQPFWKGVGFGDTRLSSSKDVMDQWAKQVLSEDSRFTNHLECALLGDVPRGVSTKSTNRHGLLLFKSLLGGWNANNLLESGDQHASPWMFFFLFIACISLVVSKAVVMKLFRRRNHQEYRILRADGEMQTSYGSTDVE